MHYITAGDDEGDEWMADEVAEDLLQRGWLHYSCDVFDFNSCDWFKKKSECSLFFLTIGLWRQTEVSWTPAFPQRRNFSYTKYLRIPFFLTA